MSRFLMHPLALAALIGPAAAQAEPSDSITFDQLQWRQMVPGVEFAPAYGEFEREAHGKFVRFTPGAKVPLHIHSNDYHAVLVSGRLTNNFADGQRVEMNRGHYWYMAAKRPHGHDCLSEEPCVVYAYGGGLWDIAMHPAE